MSPRHMRIMYVCVSRLKLIGVKVIVSILDCCREFQDEDVVDSTRGKQHLSVGSKSFGGTFIAYACGPNGYAIDGKGNHGKHLSNLLTCTVDSPQRSICIGILICDGLLLQRAPRALYAVPVEMHCHSFSGSHENISPSRASCFGAFWWPATPGPHLRVQNIQTPAARWHCSART